MSRSTDRRRAGLRDERGIALAMAVFAMVVIGALVAGSFFTGRLEQRTGLNALFGAQALAAAEAGAAATLAGWDPAFTSLPLTRDSVLPPDSRLSGNTWYVATVTHLSPTTYLIRSEGQRRSVAGTVLARRQVGIWVRLPPEAIDPACGCPRAGSVVAPVPFATRSWAQLF
ncbi:MAG: hypothetical protein H0U85_05480 [Gemmatimonadales bacterium]|nr:hypothetical protein [Gemmatimonadales bacterium]